jgi:hypothetical protein
MSLLFFPGSVVGVMTVLPAVCAGLAGAFGASVLRLDSTTSRIAIPLCAAVCAAGPVHAFASLPTVTIPGLVTGCVVSAALVVVELLVVGSLLRNMASGIRPVMLMPLAAVPVTAFSLAGRYFAQEQALITPYALIAGAVAAALFLTVCARAVRILFDPVIRAEEANISKEKLAELKWSAYLCLVVAHFGAWQVSAVRIGFGLPTSAALEQVPKLAVVVLCNGRPIVELKVAHWVVGAVRRENGPGDASFWFFRALAPVDYAVATGQHGQKLHRMAVRYRATVTDLLTRHKLRDSLSLELARMALVERRGRAVERARKAFMTEVRQFGSDFNPGSLGARLFRYIVISEFALIVAGWAQGHERDSLAAAAVALRSAWCFWLEDTDSSLPCVRTVLEQTSRARTWRVKPDRAAKIENLGALSAPVRWLEAAGWKRLDSLARALGEFSHLDARVKTEGARQILINMQDEQKNLREETARGNILDSAAYLLAGEVCARLETESALVHAAFRQTVTLIDEEEHQAQTEDLLNTSLRLRGEDLGPPTFTPAPEGAELLLPHLPLRLN